MFGSTTRCGRTAGSAAVSVLLAFGDVGAGARAQTCQTVIDTQGNPARICMAVPGQLLAQAHMPPPAPTPVPPPPPTTVPPGTVTGGDPAAIFVPGTGRLGVEGSTTVPIQLLNGGGLLEMPGESPPPGTIRVEGSGVGAPAQRLTIEGFRVWTETR